MPTVYTIYYQSYVIEDVKVFALRFLEEKTSQLRVAFCVRALQKRLHRKETEGCSGKD